MDKAYFEARVEQLMKDAQQSIANHNALLGQLAEAENTLKAFAEKEASVIEGEFVSAAEAEMTKLGNQAVSAVEAKAGQIVDAEVAKL